jgi:hypothetical protein
VTIQEPTKVTSYCNLLAPVRQLSFNSRSARMSFSQVQRVFIVENYLAFRSYLPEWVYGYISRFSCAKNIDNISSRKQFPWHRNSSSGCIKHEAKSECMHHWTRWTFPTLDITLLLFSYFNVIYFLTNITCVRNGLREFSITLYFYNSLIRWGSKWLTINKVIRE